MNLINAEVLSNFVSLQCLSSLLNALLQNMMAEQNVPRSNLLQEHMSRLLSVGHLIEYRLLPAFTASAKWFTKSFSNYSVIPTHPFGVPRLRKLPQKVRKGKPTFQLVDEDDEAQQESIPQEEGNDLDLELAKKMSLEAHQEKGEGEGDDADLE
ncbi:hypothetical protein Tco_1370639 [Tanacetum coccineum]